MSGSEGRLPEFEATLEPHVTSQPQIPSFHLEGKVAFEAGLLIDLQSGLHIQEGSVEALWLL